MGRAKVQVGLHGGRLSISWPGVATTGDIAAHALLADGRTAESTKWHQVGGSFATTCGPLAVTVRVRTASARARLDIVATARASAKVVEIGLRCGPVVLDAAPRWIVYSGYQSWDASGVAPTGGGQGGKRQSWWTLGLADDGGSGMAWSAISARQSSLRFDLQDDVLLVTAEEPSGLQRRPVLWDARRGDSWRCDPLAVAAGVDVQDELRRLARLASKRRAGYVPQGWLSWYHHGPWVAHEDVAANSAAMADGPLEGLGYRVLQVDDGWQELYGDWRANGKFPGGLSAIARMADERGQILGVWTAPFLVAAGSELARSAPDDWFVTDPITGERATDPVHLVFGPMHVLDGSHPGVRRHLRDTFRRLRADGVRYFKIDFLYAGAYAGTRALRAGVRAIRSGAGDDSYLLACGAPLLPMVGLCEGCRIGRDTATPIFDFELGSPKPTLIGDEIAEVARNQAARHFLDGWFQLDPDVALVGGNLTQEQAITCVTFCALAGGPFFTSDDLTTLDGARLELLRNRDVLALVGGQPAVPDWLPTVADRASTVWRRGDIVGIFNWREEEVSARVPVPGSTSAREMWTGAQLVPKGGCLEVTIPGLGARLVRLIRG